MKTYNIAFDIETTNLEANLIDTETGRTAARGRLENPQSAYGADVVTRIERMQKKGRAALSDALLGGMRELAERLVRETRGPVPAEVAPAPEEGAPAPEETAPAPEAEPAAIRTVAVSGNTILEHFAAGLDPSPIAVPPFMPEPLFR